MGCAEEPQDLLGQKLRDTGSDRGGGSDVGPADISGGPHDVGPSELGVTCCTDLECPGCNGTIYRIGGCGPEWCEPPFPEQCGPPVPPEMCDCTRFGETECLSAPALLGCKPHLCDNQFAGCIASNEFPPCNPDCGVWNTEESCIGAGNCHAVYQNTKCDCDQPGCCLEFQICADGPAICLAPAGCPSAMADCGRNHVPSYVEPDCFEGCVRRQDCAP